MKVSPEIQSLSPYQPSKPIAEIQREYGLEKIYNLASNENPLGPSPLAMAAIQKNLLRLNRYPDSNCHELRKVCAGKWHLPENFFCFANGSDEVIDLLARIYCSPGEMVLTSHCSFATYKLRARASRAEVIEIPLTQKFSIDLSAMGEWLQFHPQRERVRLVFLANPNNPTGAYLTHLQIENFLKETRKLSNVLVVLDEAFDLFARAPDFPNSSELLREYENLVVLKTLSQAYGLAGVRLGILLAHPEVCDLINRMRLPFNVNSLAQVAAASALEDRDYLRASQLMVWQGLDYLYGELKNLGLRFSESQASFVFFDTGTDAEHIAQELLKDGVLLRPLSAYQLPQHLRMSVGLMPENQAAIASLRKALNFSSARATPPPQKQTQTQPDRGAQL